MQKKFNYTLKKDINLRYMFKYRSILFCKFVNQFMRGGVKELSYSKVLFLFRFLKFYFRQDPLLLFYKVLSDLKFPFFFAPVRIGKDIFRIPLKASLKQQFFSASRLLKVNILQRSVYNTGMDFLQLYKLKYRGIFELYDIIDASIGFESVSRKHFLETFYNNVKVVNCGYYGNFNIGLVANTLINIDSMDSNKRGVLLFRSKLSVDFYALLQYLTESVDLLVRDEVFFESVTVRKIMRKISRKDLLDVKTKFGADSLRGFTLRDDLKDVIYDYRTFFSNLDSSAEVNLSKGFVFMSTEKALHSVYNSVVYDFFPADVETLVYRDVLEDLADKNSVYLNFR